MKNLQRMLDRLGDPKSVLAVALSDGPGQLGAEAYILWQPFVGRTPETWYLDTARADLIDIVRSWSRARNYRMGHHVMSYGYYFTRPTDAVDHLYFTKIGCNVEAEK